MSHAFYRFAPPSHERHGRQTAGREPRHSVARRVGRFAFALFDNFPETILFVLGLGMIVYALILLKFASGQPFIH